MTASVAPEHGMRFLYMDDSGATDTGYIVYSWIEVTPGCWSVGLRDWIDLRKSLYKSHRIPPATELHSAQFVMGRGNPSLDSQVNGSKQARRAVMRRALQTIGENAEIGIGSAYRLTTRRGREYAQERGRVYDELIARLDARLSTADEYAMIFMDGDGTDPTYFRSHRNLKLAERRVLEDPLFQGSHVSQWVQMADIVAWTTYQHLLRHPGKQFAHHWYEQFLRQRDVNGQPIAL